jgi:hypothetical protein
MDYAEESGFVSLQVAGVKAFGTCALVIALQLLYTV